MIPFVELRVGNWVMYKGQGLEIASGTVLENAGDYTPIPVDSIMLGKCGFVYNSYYHLWQKMRDFPEAGAIFELDNHFNVRDFGHRAMGIQIASVHQLQNVFRVLKGTELEIQASLQATIN